MVVPFCCMAGIRRSSGDGGFPCFILGMLVPAGDGTFDDVCGSLLVLAGKRQLAPGRHRDIHVEERGNSPDR